MPSLGILVNSRLEILDVDPYGVAQRAGLRRGDSLQRIGTTYLPTRVAISVRTTPVIAEAPVQIVSSNDVKETFLAAVPRWERIVAITIGRNGRRVPLLVLVTAKAFGSDAAYPGPTVTPVPTALDGSTFYL
ncbi:MAG: hypothetical protein NVSMB52_02440 [Chloroflexota bacterium]